MTNTTTTEAKWTTAAEDAKSIRVALKAAFPGIKFSVTSKSYSMGSSITVAWTDGPLTRMVERIANGKQKIDRDEFSGEILSGGNRFVFCNRELSDRVEAYAASRAPLCANKYEQENWNYRTACRVEVRPDGQLLEWDDK